ncbi:MAG: hypothetical protein H6739_34635 [Alphaproteobacteria bacterium]|nr:hypothetical protein [Alphaproteobacteria bacterium]
MWFLLGGLGLGVAWLAASSSPAPAAMAPPSGTTLEGAVPVSGLPGVYMKRGVVLSPALLRFLARLRAVVPASIPLVVTSGVRTPEAQAAALQRKRTLGDDLYALYRRGHGPQIVASLLAVANTVPAMSAVLREWLARGVAMSRHMRGDALDLRIRGLSQEQLALLVMMCQRLGARAVVESRPAHLHIEGLGG